VAIDFSQIAFEAVQPLKNSVDEIAIDIPSDLRFDKRTMILVGESDHEPNESDLTVQAYWISTIEILVMGPDRTRCRDLCLQAFQLIAEKFYSMIDRENGPIHDIARGNKYIGAAAFGGVLIDGYGARRTLLIHNTLEP
jgi:hypothetical protein